MKPSTNKCSNDHDWFVTQIISIYPKTNNYRYEFEPAIVCEGRYIGSPDLVIIDQTNDPKHNDYLDKEKYQIKIIEFKPNSKSITEVCRQLKTYQKYKGILIGRTISKMTQLSSELIFCTYEDEINEEVKTVCNILEIKCIGIKRKKTGFEKW